MTENQRKKIVKVELLETFAEIADTLYGSPMGASGENHAPGQVPDPGATAGTSKFLREDGTWLEPISIPLNDAGHDYVEIAGIKWATMNVGATSITDTGLYFQWGDTQGYTAAQVGSGEGQKYFGWADYKYGNGTSSQSASDMTKYNSTDGKTVLDASDDAAQANWGGNWRMPTTAEYVALGNAVNSAWTADYQGSGVTGLVLTDKTDSSKVLFFPAAGYCFNGSAYGVGSYNNDWSSSVNGSNLQNAYNLFFGSSTVEWQRNRSRNLGYTVRGVLDESNTLHKVAVTGNYNDLNNKPSSMPASDVSAWAKAANKPSYNLDEVSDGSTRKLADKIGKTIDTTWANLKSLRDNSNLVPGQWYRITDYTCTTTQENTQSAGHQFDIIVRADDVNVLNENAYAAKHAGDTYFANSNLAAWKLKYKLTSMDDMDWGLYSKPRIIIGYDKYLRDTAKDFSFNGNNYYAWIGKSYAVYTENETPVIDDDALSYWCFDNSDSSLDTTFNGNTMTYVDNNGETHICTRDSSYDQIRYSDNDDYYAWVDNDDSDNVVFTYSDEPSDGDDVLYCDTSGEWRNNFYFDSNDTIEKIVVKSTEEEVAAFRGLIYYMKDEFNNECPYDFKNIQFKCWYATDLVGNRSGLNGCYMIPNLDDTSMKLDVIDDTNFIFAYTFSSQQTGGLQTDFSLGGNGVYGNVIRPYIKGLNNIVFYGRNNYLNTFDSDCYNNTFGSGCYLNSFGKQCYCNSFGGACGNNSFGNECNRNSFGYSYSRNSFGINCTNNFFGNYCNSNLFGNEDTFNSFGNYCINNSFGNRCVSNSFGNYCESNSFGDYCYYNKLLKDYSKYNIFENGNQHITLTSTQTTSYSNLLRNIKICQGINNAFIEKTISHNTVNDTFQTEYKPANSQVISV